MDGWIGECASAWVQVLEIAIRDSQMTGRAAVGVVRVPLRQLSMGGQQSMWLPVQPAASRAKVSHRIKSINSIHFIAIQVNPTQFGSIQLDSPQFIPFKISKSFGGQLGPSDWILQLLFI